MRHGRVAGIVLAAGSSSRFGANKLVAEVGGEPIVRRAARHALDAGLAPVIVVLGFEAGRVGDALQGLGVTPVVNPSPADGVHSSMQAGVAQVPDDCAAAVVILADMPLVTSVMLAGLVARFRKGREPLVISRYGEVQAPPTLYSRELFPALRAAGPGGGRQVVQAHRGDAAVLDWPPALLADLDSPEDFERLRSLALE